MQHLLLHFWKTNPSSAIVALPCNAIPLVPDEHDDHVGVGVLPRVLEPRGQVVERVPPRDVIDQEGARSAAVVRARDGAERLLAGLWGHERRIDEARLLAYTIFPSDSEDGD